jgi:hypothetical protein
LVPWQVFAGIEKAALSNEASQNTCAREPGQKKNRNRVEAMPRKVTYEQTLGTDRGISFDPLDDQIIKKLFKKDIREGEEKLMLAVLESAVEDFQKYLLARHLSGKKLFREAEEWFLGKDSGALFSFESICETLQLHPDYIRQGLLLWKKTRLKMLSDEGPRQSRTKLPRTRIRHLSARLSKTA